ncbi:DUF4446 family protein [Peptococcaceae bacterium 1198_IL3148]
MYQLLLEQYNEYVILALTGLLLVSIIIQIITWAKIKKLNKNYQRLTKGIDNKNLEEIILTVNDQVDQNSQQLLEIKKQQGLIMEKTQHCISTPKIVRYNAFDHMGSNLSFSVALLDQKNDGVILTSIYGRDESRFYAKIINSGQAEQLLSPEEQEILNNK